MVLIQVDMDKIREMAYLISQEPNSYDDLIWFLAEAELRLRSAFMLGRLYKQDEEIPTVEVDPNLIVDQPSEEEIRVLAEDLAKKQITLQELHWFIAERRLIYNSVKQF
jgi:hypothetical protein